MSALDQYIASREKKRTSVPLNSDAIRFSPETLAILPDLLKSIPANAAGTLADFASMPLAAYTSGFSMGNGQYPGKVMGQAPGSTDWIGKQMGADVNSPGFLAGGFLSPDPTDIAKLTAVGKLAANYPALNAVLAGMTAWHGGPHKFDKFDMSKIGTGEGAQAYGHGLYFAENPKVAGQYKEKLSAGRGAADADILARVFDGNEANRSAAVAELRRRGDYVLKAPPEHVAGGDPQKSYEKFNRLADMLEGGFDPSGHLYEVDIPDEAIAKMLDWDKPLSEQPESVRKALVDEIFALGNRADKKGFSLDVEYDGGLEADLQQLLTGDASAGAIYKRVSDGYLPEAKNGSKGQQALSESLRNRGIPGIRYLDGSSRSAGEGTRNFVVFDDTIPKVVSRNGEKLK